MNQILITQNDNNYNNKKDKREKKAKKEKKQKNNINYGSSPEQSTKTIVKVFATLILLFGLALCGNGTYAVVQNIKENQNSTLPIVMTQRVGNKVTLTISTQKGIRTLLYSWNNVGERIVSGGNRTEIEHEIEIPENGERLNISVVDSTGKQTNYVKNFVYIDSDVTEPKIELEVINSDVKITATDETQIDYIIYKYGDEEEVMIYATEEDQTTIETTIPVIQGQNTLAITAVDKEKNTTVKDQEIKGVKKPVVTVEPDSNDPSYIIIKATDEEGLRMISYYINDQEYKTDPNTSLNTTSFEWRQQIERGTNNITIHAYNISDQVTEFVGIYTY